MSQHDIFTGTSTRHCLTCDKPTKFKFNEKTGHSSCTLCGEYKTNKRKNFRLQAKMGKKYFKKINHQPKKKNELN